jgi:chitodextrinase
MRRGLALYVVPVTALLLAVVFTAVGAASASPLPHSVPPSASPPPANCDPPSGPLQPAATPIVEAAVARNPSDAGIDLDFCSIISGVTGPYYLNWTFGDGTMSTVRDPVHVYTLPANYTVDLRLNSSDFNTTSTIYALVNASVQASADYTPLAPTTATAVNFTDSARLGTPPYSIFWKFGDGTTATGRVVLHRYLAAGNYTVQVWTNDTGGGSVNQLYVVHITAAPNTGQLTGNTDILIGTSVAAVAVGLGGFAYLQWDKKRRPKLPTTAPPPPSPPKP